MPLALVLATVVSMFAGVGAVRDLVGPRAATTWQIGRWPTALISALLVFSFLYFVTPDVEQRAFRWITPGAAVGVTLWLVASAAFSVFIAHFSSFSVTYGSFAAAIILLIWLWLTNSRFSSAPRSTARSNASRSSRRRSRMETLNLPPRRRISDRHPSQPRFRPQPAPPRHLRRRLNHLAHSRLAVGPGTPE